jgi:hypothetical protein
MALSSRTQEALVSAAILSGERAPSAVGNRSVNLIGAQIAACCLTCDCATGPTGPAGDPIPG